MLRAPVHGALLHGVLLHGRLDVEVLRAEKLWEPGARSARERFVRALASGTGLNPYATMRLEQLPRYKRVLKTAAIPNTDAPVWNHTCSIDVATNVSYIVVHVKTAASRDQSARLCPHKSLGFVRIKAENVLLNVVDGWFPLSGYQGIRDHDNKNRGRIEIKLTYHRVEEIMSPLRGRLPTVPGTYFQPVERCHVQLFQDAHCPQGAVLHIPGSSDYLYGKEDVPSLSPMTDRDAINCMSPVSTDAETNQSEQNEDSRDGTTVPCMSPPLSRLPSVRREPAVVCDSRVRFPRMYNYFEEIYRAIYNARKLVYITGWSVDTTMRLLREQPSTPHFTSSDEERNTIDSQRGCTEDGENQEMLPNLTLGELLKLKADQGVRVLLLVWDEVFSSNHPLLRWKGLMNTKDEVTREFFRNSKVKAAVVPRIGRAGRMLKAPIVPCMFTFHEKLIIIDVPLKTPHHLSREEDNSDDEELDHRRAQGHGFTSHSLKTLLTSRLPNLPNLSNLPYLHSGGAANHGQSHHARSHSFGGHLHNPLHSHSPHTGGTKPGAGSNLRTRERRDRGFADDAIETAAEASGMPRSPQADSSGGSVLSRTTVDRPANTPLVGDKGLFSVSNLRSRQPQPRVFETRSGKGSSSSATCSNTTGSGLSAASSGTAEETEEQRVRVSGASRVRLEHDAGENELEVETVLEDTAESADCVDKPVSSAQHASWSRSQPSLRAMLTSRIQFIPGHKQTATAQGETVENAVSPIDTTGANKSSKASCPLNSPGTVPVAVPSAGTVVPDRAQAEPSNIGGAVVYGKPPASHHGKPPLRDPNSRNPGAIALNAVMAGTKGLSNLTPKATPAVQTGEKRQLTAFIGGLDLTYGRFDTPDHSLFRTLETIHKDDFHNACYAVGKTFGPREPWHDVAANVTGPVVRDLASCFEERWRRQGRGIAHLVDIANDAEIHDGPFAHEEEQWTVQIFRSIDERSAVFTRETERLLETKKGRRVDRSIHHAYVHYTRAAKRFIYIEQQYFIGSSNQWLSDTHSEATNLIPYELALKIANSISKSDPIRVYIVIPLFPEGIPSDLSLQQILFFQFKTVEMMYRKIADAIAAAKLENAHPTDYLNFFCLGNREVNGPRPVPSDAAASPVTPLEPDPLLSNSPEPCPERPPLLHNRVLSKPRWFGSRRNSNSTAFSITESDSESMHMAANGLSETQSSGTHRDSCSSSDDAEAAAVVVAIHKSKGERKTTSTTRTISSAGASVSSSRSSLKPPRAQTNSFAWSTSDSVRDPRKQRYPRAGDEEALQRTRRHPIYQHAKLFISDDEIIMTGSSNLNERSMAGVRDTEMVIGAFQPSHIYPVMEDNERNSLGNGSQAELPQGEVARFRKRLWAEHALGSFTTEFPQELCDPGKLDCVRKLQEIAKANWDAYTGDAVVELQSHLLSYPYKVHEDGTVTPMVRHFPDTKATVIGAFSNIIPNILTS